MTTDAYAIDAELEGLEDSLDADYRANVAPGTVVGEQHVQGGIFRQLKGQTLEGRPDAPSVAHAPNRIVVYDTRTGMPSRIPYAQRRYHLGKRRADGSRVYSLQMPAGIAPRVPIDDTCTICQRNRNGRKRDFYSEFDLLTHMQLFHTLEWNAMERDRDIKERREDANRMERLIGSLVALIAPSAVDKLPDDVREQIAGLQAKEAGIPDAEDKPKKGK